MGKSIIREGLRRTYIMGIAFAVISAIFGILSLVKDQGNTYMLTMTLLIPLIPLPVLVVLMRYLNDQAAVDFYSTLPISFGTILREYIIVSQVYVWSSFILGVVPFFIKDAINVEVFTTWHSQGNAAVTNSIALQILIGKMGEVFAISLLITGLTLIIIAITNSSVAQFFLTLAIAVLPTILFQILGSGLSALFINTGNSYYNNVTHNWSGEELQKLWQGLLKSAGVVIIGFVLIWIGIKLVGRLRRIDVDNNTSVHRILNAVVSAVLGLWFIFAAAVVAVQYMADSVFVSFHGEASDEAMYAFTNYGKINIIGKFPWSSIILYVILGIIVTLILTIRGSRKKNRKWIDYTLSFSILAVICTVFIGIYSVHYSSSIRLFDCAQIDSVKILQWPDDGYGNDYLNAYEYWKITADGFYSINIEEAQDETEEIAAEYYRISYLARNAAPFSKAVMAANGKVYSNFCEGNLSLHPTYGKNLDIDAPESEVMSIIVNAANQNANTIKTAIQTGSPVYDSYNGGFLIVNIDMKNGSSYLRRIYLTENEQDKINDLLK